MSNPEPQVRRLIWSYSITPDITLGLLFLIPSFATLIGAVTDYPRGDHPVGLSPYLAVSQMILLVAYAHSFSSRERAVYFYEDGFTILGRKTKLDVPYSQITDASLRKMRWLGLPSFRRGMYVAISGHPGHFQIPNANPPLLKSDLYSWLVAKSGCLPFGENYSSS